MAALGALTKCRLCLKLGEFYSIFAVDNSVQLARMAMACSNVQIHEGDGLPDRVCGECVEKLSAAYIFKQQCERSDSELRKSMLNLGNNHHQLKDMRTSTPTRKRKFYDESPTNLLEETYSVHIRDTYSMEAANLDTSLTLHQDKKRRTSDVSSGGKSNSLECKICNKVFTTYRGRNSHQRMHKNASAESKFVPVPIKLEPEDYYVEERIFTCGICDESFRDKNLYREHFSKCIPSSENNMLSAVDIEQSLKKTTCPVCFMKYKKRNYLQKHLDRSSCGVTVRNRIQELKGESSKIDSKITVQGLLNEVDFMGSQPETAQCSNCKMTFPSHSVMLGHFYKCLSAIGEIKIECLTCNFEFLDKKTFANHLKSAHISSNSSSNIEPSRPEGSGSLQCHKCDKIFDDQEKLVMHLAAHMANYEDSSKATFKKSQRPFKCEKCNKSFRHRGNLHNHIKSHKSFVQSSVSGDKLNQCDMCDKSFQYAKSLAIHKQNKHRAAEDSYQEEPINKRLMGYSKLPVRCVHCNLMLNGRKETKLHNRIHMRNKEKPHNEYTCICGVKFTNTKVFYNHYKEHDFTNDNEDAIYDASISNFCEVTTEMKSDSEDEELNTDVTIDQPIVDEFISSQCVNPKEDSNSFSCFVCHANFDFESSYRKHMKIHYYDKNIDRSLLICKLCKRESKNMRSYIAHMSWHTTTGRFKCYRCGENFQYIKAYGNHMLVEHDVDIAEATQCTDYNCYICKRYYHSEDSLRYHLECHENGEDFKDGSDSNNCTFCQKKFSTKYQLIMHLQSNHNTVATDDSPSESPKAKISGVSKRPMQSNAKIKCTVCDMKFITPAGLTKHTRRFHLEIVNNTDSNDIQETSAAAFPCTVCTRTFTDSDQLDNHVKEHNKSPEIFRCTLCLRQSPSMKIHMIHLAKSHLNQFHNDNPLPCDYCGEKFPRRQSLKGHLRIVHNIIENYVEVYNTKKEDLHELQCHICYKTFSMDTYFQKHMQTHVVHQCNYCFKYFDSKDLLSSHVLNACDKKRMKNVNPFEKKLKCRLCPKSYSLLIKLNCHLMTQHNVDTVDVPFAFKPCVCDFCFSVFNCEERMLSHKKGHNHSGCMLCKICDKGVQPSGSKKHKWKHISESFEENPLKCDHCDETFTKVRPLISHWLQAHEKQWIWYSPKVMTEEKCGICHKVFPNLPRHLMYHEKYKCKNCLQYFTSEILFKDHICDAESEPEPETPNETIDTTRPGAKLETLNEECEFCFKAYTGQYSKSKHMYNHNSMLFYGCRLCSKRFPFKAPFQHHATAHKQQQFAKNPLQCRHCQENFITYASYSEHMRHVHHDQETLKFQPEFLLEECLICKKSFGNIYRHYKYHKETQCKNCLKYFLSFKLFHSHNCGDSYENSDMVVTYDGDISKLIIPDFKSYEIERSPTPYAGRSNFVDGAKNNRNNLRNFSPVISSTMSLSSTAPVSEDVEENGDIDSFDIKNEPIDDYYKDYSPYDFQNSLLNMNHSG